VTASVSIDEISQAGPLGGWERYDRHPDAIVA
jgi:hypothetical protein